MKRYFTLLIGAMFSVGFCEGPVFHGLNNSFLYAVYSESMVKEFDIKGVYTEKLPKKMFSIYKIHYPDLHACYLGISMLESYFKARPKNIFLIIQEQHMPVNNYPLVDSMLGNNPKMNYVGFKLPCSLSLAKAKGAALSYISGKKIYTEKLSLKAIKRAWEMKSESPPIQGSNVKFLALTFIDYQQGEEP